MTSLICNSGRKASNSPRLAKICVRWFGPPRINGSSHHVYRMPWSGDPRINIQRGNNGAAKAYQVKQVIAALARMEEEHGKA
ncbi:toxin HicA [Serratia marcescens]|uniref:toxin HicA n=1 Tax=Serratia TaxID=613 RepID=UPI001F14F465|nr:toxin HicA [Serratia marcescens]